MVKIRAIVFVTLFLIAGATAQQTPDAQQCKIYFTVLQADPHLPGGSIAQMSPEQQKWWEKKGTKKFPAVCYDPSRATYKIVWWRDTVSYSGVAKNTYDSRYDVAYSGTRDVGYGYLKSITASDADKPLLYVDRDDKGTAHVLQRAIEFLSK